MVVSEFSSIVDSVLRKLGLRYHVYYKGVNAYSIYFRTDEVSAIDVASAITAIAEATGAIPHITRTAGKVYLDYSVTEEYVPVDPHRIRIILAPFIGKYVQRLTLYHDKASKHIPKTILSNPIKIYVIRRIGYISETKESNIELYYGYARSRGYIVLRYVFKGLSTPHSWYDVMTWRIEDEENEEFRKTLSKIVSKIRFNRKTF